MHICLIITLQSPFSIYKGVPGSVVNFTVHYSLGDNETVPANCTGDVCEYMFQVPSTVCPPSRNVSMVSVLAWIRAAFRIDSDRLVLMCVCVYVCVCVCVHVCITVFVCTCELCVLFQVYLAQQQMRCSNIYYTFYLFMNMVIFKHVHRYSTLCDNYRGLQELEFELVTTTCT